MSTETELLTRFGFAKRRPGFDQVSDSILSTISRVPDAIIKNSGGTFTIAPGSSNAVIGPLAPPLNPPEEWEILMAWVIDTAHIDQLDTVTFYYTFPDEDNNIGAVPLNVSPGVANSRGGQATFAGALFNYWRWPATISDTTEGPSPVVPLLLRKVALQNRSLQAQMNTTATAGNRIAYIAAYLRRRVV
jgi:hypothetical protein